MWKVTQTPEGQQGPTSTVKSRECKRYAVHSSATFANSSHKFIVPEVRFHAEMICASLAVIDHSPLGPKELNIL